MGGISSKSKYGEIKVLFTLKESKNQLRMLEYGLISLTSIVESYKYWKYNVAYAKRVNISMTLFEDIFGSLIKDPDNHFDDFSVTNNVGNKSCNLYEIICTFSLFCNEANKVKVEFLFDLFRTDEARDLEISRKEIHNIIDHIIAVINHLFTIKDIDKSSILNSIDKVMALLYNRIQAEKGESTYKLDDGGPTKAELDAIRLTFTEFWQLCQDVSIIWDFLNTIESITTILVAGKFQHYEEEKDIDDQKEKKDDLDLEDEIEDHDIHDITIRVLKDNIDSGNIDDVALTSVYNRTRHALWSYTVKDLVDENWLTTLPYVTSEDAVFTALENMICLSKSYFPIFAKEPMATYGETPLSPNAKNNFNSNKIITSYKPKGKYELFCLLDIYSILKLIAQHAPYMFKVNDPEEDRPQSPQKTNENSQSDSQMLKMRGFDRSRQWAVKGATKAGSQWQDFGKIVANSTIRQLIDSQKSNIQTKLVLTENYIYDLIYMIAQGQRSIPVATSKLFPSKVTYVISDNDIAQFMLKNANELLGKLMRLQIQKTNLVKKAATISCNTKLGNAICNMTNRGIDVAAVIDEKGKICGRFCSEIVNNLWLTWYQQNVQDESITFNEVITAFNNNNFKAYDSKDAAVKFNVFSKLLAPLKNCDGIVTLKYFDEVMNKQIDVEEDDDSYVSSSSSYSDTDSSDDDGDGDGSKASKQKVPENKNNSEIKTPSKKGKKSAGRSSSPSKKSGKNSSKKRSTSPSKRRTKIKSRPRSRSPSKKVRVSEQTVKREGELAVRPSEIVSSRIDENSSQSAPLRPSEISSGRTFTKRTARVSKTNNLKFQMEEQRLQNIEKQKMEAEAKRIKILKARITLAKERVRWFKEMGIGIN